MFILVLLIAQVSAEWVEISQNNWNRPESPRLKQTENVQYFNQSRRGAINKVSHIGNVRRVPFASVKTPSVKPYLDATDGRRIWKGSLTKIRPQSAEDDDVHVSENPKIKSYPFTSRPGDSPAKYGDHNKVNNGSFRRVYIEEITPSSSDRHTISASEIKNPFEEASVKATKGNEKLKIISKEKPDPGDWRNTSVSEENKIERVWAAVKLVSATISKHSRRGFKSKVRYLEDLKDTITNSIEGHIDRLWPDDDSGRFRRSTEARGHVEVPSSEGALMTISFLTFAVFLIKLVLQVIHAYKQKAMMVTPAVLAAVGRTSGTFLKNLR